MRRSAPYRQVSRRVDAKRVFWAPDRSLHSCVVVVLRREHKSSSHTPKSPVQWQLNRFGGASGTGSDLSTAPTRLVARCVASKKVGTWAKTYVVFSTETQKNKCLRARSGAVGPSVRDRRRVFSVRLVAESPQHLKRLLSPRRRPLRARTGDTRRSPK